MKTYTIVFCLAVLLLGSSLAQACTSAFCVTSSADSGLGTLRQEIADAISAGGTNTIQFAIPGTGPQTITLLSQLPGITGNLTIDGYSQPGSVMNTNAPDQGGLNTKLMIEVTGGGGVGFYVLGSASFVTLTVQGLDLHGFGDAIAGNSGTPGTSQVNVYGNFIGTKLDGTAYPTLGNTGTAVNSGLSSAQIGGTQPWQRNLLSGNGGAGALTGGPAIVEANLVGTDASGMLAIPNGTNSNWPGIILGGLSNVRVGGTSTVSRNVISGNHTFGIGIWSSFGLGGQYVGFEIKGNYIGTDWTGTQPLPNGYADPQFAQFGGGIQLQYASAGSMPALIGGFALGEVNLIAYNNGAGIISGNNRISESFDSQANVIHHNRGVGGANIDIGPLGPTPNDPGDADTGANGVQNWPEIISASQSGNQLTVTYRVDSTTTNSVYPLRIDFYADVQGGSGALLAQDSYPAASAQLARTVTLTLPAGAKAIPFVTTATSANGYTSEFSPAVDVIFEDDFE